MKIEDIIASAAEELNASYENNALWFEVLINQAIRSHRTPKLLVEKNYNLEVNDEKTVLPNGWSKIIGLYLCSTNEKFCPDIDYTIQDNIVIFDSSKNMQDGTKVNFRYYGLKQDEHGKLSIPDDWERMLVAYIGWKYTRRYFKDFGVAIIQNYQREYQNQKLFNI
jgi:hypothetical protein